MLPQRGSGPYTVVGEYPSIAAVSHKRPFTGPGGELLRTAFRKAGTNANSATMHYAVMCRAPEGRLDSVLGRLRARNAERRKQNTQRRKGGEAPLPMLPTPMECCRPGVQRVVTGARYILAAGKLAAGALLGGSLSTGSLSLQAIRGGILDGTLVKRENGSTRLYAPSTPVVETDTVLVADAKIVPTMSPGMVHAKQRWTGTLECDVDRLVRWSHDALTWSEPSITYHPLAAELATFLMSGPGPLTYDVETDGIVALDCNVRCVGLGNGTGNVVVVGTRSRSTTLDQPDGEDGTFYGPTEMELVKELFRRFFGNADILKVGHNAGYYDFLVMRAWLSGTVGRPWEYDPDTHFDVQSTLDNLMMHRLAESELPHSLGYVGSRHTDAPSWKADRQGRKLATGSETDRELHKYCGMDVGVTEACTAPLVRAVEKTGQTSIIAIDHQVQRVCADMHHVGMFVDQTARAAAERELLAKAVSLRKELQDVSGVPDLNPGSTHQLRRLLFRDWGLTPRLDDRIRFTATGDASTSDNVMRALLSQRLKKQHRIFVKRLRQYRKVMKELGTYVVKLRPMTDVVSGIGWDDEAQRLEWEAERDPELLAMMVAEREKRGYDKRGIVWADGRMRPGYNAHGTLMGRLSSSSPINAQNFPKHLRKLIVPQPGNVFVMADYDQLELRVAAARWKLQRYIDAFDAGHDPHTTVTAFAIFGEAFVAAAGSPWPWVTGTKFEGDANRMRQLAKIIQYMFQYKGSVETGTRLIQSTELGDGSLPYALLGVKEVRQMRGSWMQGIPQLESGWRREIGHYRRHGYVAEPVHGRRRYFLDGENPNEIVNTPIQGSAAALVNDAMIGLWRDIPLHKWGPGTGLLTQTHDELVVECPREKAQWVIDCMNHHMNKIHPALPGVTFTAEAEMAMTWKGA